MATHRLLDEGAHAGAEHLDPAYVSTYDRKAQADPAADLRELVSRGLGARSTLVDLGAGTGTFAVAAAALCERVVAVDVSPEMVKAIRSKASEHGATNVTCVEAGFLSYRHDGSPADFVYTRHALHHLPDLWKAVALRRMADMLRPGGVLMVRDLMFSFEPAEADERIAAWLDAAPADPAAGWTQDELQAHLRHEFSTFTWLLEPMIEHAGLEIAHADLAPNGIHAAYVCVKPG